MAQVQGDVPAYVIGDGDEPLSPKQASAVAFYLIAWTMLSFLIAYDAAQLRALVWTSAADRISRAARTTAERTRIRKQVESQKKVA